ncbi:MAG TPA: hypothetical protein PLZ29_12185, partial [Spirochaetota bacterium]|nr:hypothetical protein [Spirochaetota bacterium]
ILFCVEAVDADPLYTLSLIQAELSTYNDNLSQRHSIILLTKSDMVSESVWQTRWELLKKEKYDCVPISSLTGYNIDILIEKLFLIME